MRKFLLRYLIPRIIQYLTISFCRDHGHFYHSQARSY